MWALGSSEEIEELKRLGELPSGNATDLQSIVHLGDNIVRHHVAIVALAAIGVSSLQTQIDAHGTADAHGWDGVPSRVIVPTAEPQASIFAWTSDTVIGVRALSLIIC